MSKFVLPELSYDYGALEPHISGKIMQLHHDKHHAAYVNGANTTLEKLHDARQKKDFGNIPLLEKQLAFHVSGHVMHSIFWQNLSPKGGGEPKGALLEQINKDFGDFASFKAQLTQATGTIMGSGWGALSWEPMSQRLITSQVYDHQSEAPQSAVHLMVIDAWEHAFYLQYENNKMKFFEAIWNIVNWDDVSQRYENAKKLDLALKNVAG